MEWGIKTMGPPRRQIARDDAPLSPLCSCYGVSFDKPLDSHCVALQPNDTIAHLSRQKYLVFYCRIALILLCYSTIVYTQLNPKKEKVEYSIPSRTSFGI